jgi:hypothetical protein
MIIGLLVAQSSLFIKKLLPLEAVPAVRGKPGRPLRPRRVPGDRGYDSQRYRRLLRAMGITPVLAKRGAPHGSGLGVYRWVVEISQL